MFRDEARITVRAGRGGDGKVSFRREKYVPKGGPDGGDGGRGGDVVLRATDQVNTLYEVARRPAYRAAPGGDGGARDRHGADGASLVLEVPAGTVVRDAIRGHVLKDLVGPGDEVRVARGGAGGRGNHAFASATRQVPRVREEGRPGEERDLVLELRVVADVGLVGLPNAGKSTFLARVSSARPKIADYPFTTVDPVLGVVALPGWRRMVIADLPGLIEGAHRGAGLGHRFLRHAGRTRVLLHLVAARPLAGPRPAEAWRQVRRELERYGGGLEERPEVVVLTKCDLPGWEEDREELARACGGEVYPVSAVTGRGLPEALGAASRVVEAAAGTAGGESPEVRTPAGRPAKGNRKAKRSGRRGRANGGGG
jgi:GTP-binding protein